MSRIANKGGELAVGSSATGVGHSRVAVSPRWTRRWTRRWTTRSESFKGGRVAIIWLVGGWKSEEGNVGVSDQDWLQSMADIKF